MSWKDAIDQIMHFVPQIEPPSRPINIKEKLMYTSLVLVLYFLLYNTYAFGVLKVTTEQNELLTILFASKIGTIITVGIGPIILSSILLQLLAGADLIKFDINNPIERNQYQELQKLVGIAIAILESVIYATSGYVSVIKGFEFVVMLQFFIGAMLVMYLDEIVGKYGIGSGISLFIASGVAFSIVGGIIRYIFPSTLMYLTEGYYPGVIYSLLPLIFAIAVFVVVIYVYKIKVEIPMSFQQVRGYGGRLPIPLLYVSNIPVLLTSSLIMLLTSWFVIFSNAQGVAGAVAKVFAVYTNQGGRSTLVGGLLYLISPVFPSPYIIGYENYINFLASGFSQFYIGSTVVNVPELLHVVFYIVFNTLLCVVFGLLWIETTGQNPEEVAKQVYNIGWQIPGYRKDPRVIQKILEGYIPTITILGSMVVGLLASFATLTGALGTGIGILLFVGIVSDFITRLENEGFFEAYPSVAKLLK